MENIEKLYKQLDRVNTLSNKLEATLKATKEDKDITQEKRAEQTLACYIMRAALTRTQIAIVINLHALGESPDVVI